MKILKNESDRKVRISINLSPKINNILKENTTNTSKYIEFALLEYFNKCNLDTTKIKL
jgi:hypothetical protein